MSDDDLTGFALDHVLEMLYNLRASCRVSKTSHLWKFGHTTKEHVKNIARIEETAGIGRYIVDHFGARTETNDPRS